MKRLCRHRQGMVAKRRRLRTNLLPRLTSHPRSTFENSTTQHCMKNKTTEPIQFLCSTKTNLKLLLITSIATLASLPVFAMDHSHGHDQDEDETHYRQINLVSDISAVAQVQDTNLVNAWGISHSPTSPFWISDNGSGKS